MSYEVRIESPEQRAKALFEEHCEGVATAALAHLRIHYPEALKAVPKTAPLSLRNSIKSQLRSRFAPLLSVMIELERTWPD